MSVTFQTHKPSTGETFTKDVDFPVLLPHQIFAHLHQVHPLLFKKLYMGDCNDQGMHTKLEEFWTTVQASQDPRLDGHPMKSIPRWQQRPLPLSLHGDAVPVDKVGKAGTKSMDVYSTFGLLGRDSTTILELYKFCLFTASEVKENNATMENI